MQSTKELLIFVCNKFQDKGKYNNIMKVISFSLWGSNDKYCLGAIYNAVIAKEIYQGWLCRFYIDIDTVPVHIISTLKNMDNVEIVRKSTVRNIFNSDTNPMIWRFREVFTIFDAFGQNSNKQKENIFIIRDTDSRPSLRERECVLEFEKSDTHIHIVRDHPCHKWNFILGGLWGGKNLSEEFVTIFKEMYIKYQTKNPYFQTDQCMLLNIFSKDITNLKTLIHDDFNNEFPNIKVNKVLRKIPIRKGYEFMGSPFDENNNQEKDSIQSLKNIIG